MSYLKWIKILAPLVVAIMVFSFGYYEGQKSANAKWQKKWDAQQQQILESNLEFERKEREKEQSWSLKLNEANTEAQALREQLKVTIDNGRAVDDRLREQYQKLSVRFQRCQNSAIANGSPGAEQTEYLFPQLLARCDERKRELAEYADRLEIAHSTCFKSYASLQNTEAVK